MHKPGARKVLALLLDADPQDAFCGFQVGQHFSEAGVAVARKVLGHIPCGRHTQGEQRLLGSSTHHLVLGKRLLRDPDWWQTAFRQVPLQAPVNKLAVKPCLLCAWYIFAREAQGSKRQECESDTNQDQPGTPTGAIEQGIAVLVEDGQGQEPVWQL